MSGVRQHRHAREARVRAAFQALPGAEQTGLPAAFQ